MKRRETLDVARNSLASLMIGLPLCIWNTEFACAVQSLTWPEFITRLTKLVSSQFSSDWNQDSYVDSVCRKIALLDLDGLPLSPIKQGRIEFQSLYKVNSFEVTQIAFDQGCRIPPHNHPGMTGVLTCLSGKLRVINYELTSEGQLKQVADVVLRQSEVSVLTANKHNIHQVIAVTPCVVMDIFTPPYNTERERKTKWYGN
ncbi:2-aminoethanethiol dioxygenase [Gloeobacter kilaueensis]|uniref:Cysteine dioxygenase n=1 Tax=Gloeobacter kilaueensis (strain ATCC BAA-2537 / CCAP 1431/1 / ULC 316 / JS1) TaxID=1183438 RepID=U5QM70_GLOK1|nr:hypothetical protein [Gloeobacter kilaueensis]AGY60011.1 hypothetical protein GKIL_3765 [Gloeobacter kilaueensis JS1]